MSSWYDEAEDRPAARMDWRLWRRLIGYSLRYRRWTAILVVQAVATGTIDASFHLVTRNVVDASVSDAPDAERTLLLWLAAYGVLAIALAVCVRVFVRFGGRIRAHVAHDIRRDAFDNLQRLSQAYFDQRPVGWLMARMTSDCERLSMALSWGALDIAWGAATMSVASVAMLWMDWRLGLVGIGVIPPLWLVSLWFQRRIIGTAREVRGLNSRLTASFNETLSGVRTLRAFGAQRRFQEEFEELSERMRERSVTNAILSAMYLPAVLGIAGMAAGLCLGLGGVRVVAGTISIGTLIAFLGYTRQFFEPLQEMAAWFCEFQMAQASAERVFGLVDEVPSVVDTPAATARIVAQVREPRAGAATDGLPLDRRSRAARRPASRMAAVPEVLRGHRPRRAGGRRSRSWTDRRRQDDARELALSSYELTAVRCSPAASSTANAARLVAQAAFVRQEPTCSAE
ncbi:MAG: ABC transporter transmembrane domain-containing protein [Planctomycetota bacterium]